MNWNQKLVVVTRAHAREAGDVRQLIRGGPVLAHEGVEGLRHGLKLAQCLFHPQKARIDAIGVSGTGIISVEVNNGVGGSALSG